MQTLCRGRKNHLENLDKFDSRERPSSLLIQLDIFSKPKISPFADIYITNLANWYTFYKLYNSKYSRRTFLLQILINSFCRLRSRIPSATSNWWCRKCSPDDFDPKKSSFLHTSVPFTNACQLMCIFLFLFALFVYMPLINACQISLFLL